MLTKDDFPQTFDFSSDFDHVQEGKVPEYDPETRTISWKQVAADEMIVGKLFKYQESMPCVEVDVAVQNEAGKFVKCYSSCARLDYCVTLMFVHDGQAYKVFYYDDEFLSVTQIEPFADERVYFKTLTVEGEW
jgi:hypothetical protein